MTTKRRQTFLVGAGHHKGVPNGNRVGEGLVPSRIQPFRFTIAATILSLLSVTIVAAENPAPIRVYPFAAAVVPEAIAAPLIDGKIDDLAWRNPAAAPRLLTPTPEGFPAKATASIRLACDAHYLYLFFSRRNRLPSLPVSTGGKKTPREFLSIELGAAPWLSKQIRITPGGRGQESQWTGWEMSPQWRSRSRVVALDSATAWQAEIAIPRVELSPATVRQGARVALRLTLHGRDGQALAHLSMADGYGVVLGKDFAPRSIKAILQPNKKSTWQLTMTHWNAKPIPLRASVFTFINANKEERKSWSTLTLPPTSRTTIMQLPAPPQALSRSPIALRLRPGKSGAQGYDVYPLLPPREFVPTKQYQHIREALKRTAALPNSKRNPDPYIIQAQEVLADWNRQAYLAALAKLVLAVKNSTTTKKASPRSPVTPDDGLSSLSRDMLTEAYDAAGRPRWKILVRLAKNKAYARIAYQNALRFSDIQKLIAKNPAAESAPLTAEVTQRFRTWQAHRQTLPPPTVRRVHPAWQMDIAAVRLLVLIDLARGAFVTRAGQGALADCLEEILTTAAWLQNNLNRSGTSYPYKATVGRAVVAAAEYFPILFRSEEKGGFIAYSLSAQLAAHTLPDGASVLPDATQLQFMRLLVRRNALAPKHFLTRTTLAPRPLGKKILTYLAARILPTGPLAQLADTSSTLTEADLAEWGRLYYPAQPAFGRFTPEGLIAIPQHESVPRDATRVFGGVYTMRGRADSLVCIVTGGGRRGFGDPFAAAEYGRVLLADSRHEYLTGGAVASGQMQLAGRGVALGVLPPTGEALPHRWQRTADADYLTLPWQPTGGNPVGVKATRNVLFIKGLAERSVVYICDVITRTPSDSPRGIFTQTFTRPTDIKLHARLIPLAGRTISYRPAQQNRARMTISGTLSGRDAAELFIIPPQVYSALPAPTFKRLGKRLKAGGGVYFLRGSSTRRDYILSDPGRVGLSGAFGVVEAQLIGEVALVRLDEKGLASISGFSVSRVELTRGATWAIRCTPSASISLRRKRGGGFVVERLDAKRMPVTFEFSLTPQGAKEARTVRLQLEVGKRIVFQLL